MIEIEIAVDRLDSEFSGTERRQFEFQTGCFFRAPLIEQIPQYVRSRIDVWIPYRRQIRMPSGDAYDAWQWLPRRLHRP